MSNIQITAQLRTEFGKGAARRTRRAGLIPAVIYGADTELLHVSLPGHELRQALRKPRIVLEVSVDGGTYLVAPRDVQRDVVRQILEHVDLVVVSRAEAKERAAAAAAIIEAAAAAEEAGLDPAAAVAAVTEAIDAGEDPAAAVEQAVEAAAAAEEEAAAAETAADEADEAAAEEAAEVAEAAEEAPEAEQA